MNPPSLRGVALVLAAAVLWGTTGTAQSFAPPQLSSYWVGALRLVASSLFFVAWLVLTERQALGRAAMTSLPWRGVVAAAVCMSAYNLAFFAGVRASGVAVGTAIAIGSGPVWAGILQAVVSRRPPSLAWWLGTVLAVGGGALMISASGAVQALTPLGVALCLAAGLSYAIYALVNKTLVADASAAAVTGAVFTLAALLSLPTSTLQETSISFIMFWVMMPRAEPSTMP